MITLFSRNPNRFTLAIVAALILGALIIAHQNPNPASAQERSNFVGGIEENRQAAEDEGGYDRGCASVRIATQ